jgi:hypothetical protein
VGSSSTVGRRRRVVTAPGQRRKGRLVERSAGTTKRPSAVGHQTNASIVAHVVVIWHVAKRDARPRQSRHLILVTSTDRRADCLVVPCWSLVRGPRCWRDHADRRNKTKQQTNSNSNSTNEIHSTGAGGGNSAVARDQNDWHC